MPLFAKFEEQVLDRLASGALTPAQLSAIKLEGTVESYNYTGHGYFLTINHPCIPSGRITCSQPMVTGSAEGYLAGFVIFIEKHQITFECYTLGEDQIPSTFRELNVILSAT